jgi:predicted P-loop ATPase
LGRAELNVNGKAKAKAEAKAGADKATSAPLSRELTNRLYIKDNGAGKPHADYPSRSELFFAFVTVCLRAGVAAEVIADACLDDAHRGDAIYEHCSDNGGRNYIERQVSSAEEQIENDFELDGNKATKARSQKNIAVALKQLGISLSYNEFADQMLIDGLGHFKLLNDYAVIRLWFLIEERFKFQAAKEFFRDAIIDLARANAFHPVRDYIDNLKWDGVERLGDWLVKYAGVKDTKYTRAVGRLMLVAAVKRVRHPGCQFDEMLALDGPQGTLKSTLIRTLAVKQEWFLDDLSLSANTQKLIEQVRGKWIIEVSELAGMKKAELEHVKAMLSRTHDRSRLSYDRIVTDLPRHCVFFGTTNDAKYLRDQTGNRRIWPATITTIDIEALMRDRDQLWAEAAAAETRGESIRLSKELWSKAKREQDERLEDEPWIEMIEEVLGDKEGKITKRDVGAIINRPSGQITAYDNKRLVHAMKSLGWKDDKKLRFGSDPEHCWYRGDASVLSGLKTITIKVVWSDGKQVAKAEYQQGSQHNPGWDDEKEM